MLFSLFVVAFACHHVRLFGPLGWRLSFSCFSPRLLWPLLATIRAYLAHWAGAFPSHAFLPACCGSCLPPCAPIWPTGLAPFLLMLFSLLVVAFAKHILRLFGPLGWRLSFSCFSPCLLWPLLATIRAFFRAYRLAPRSCSHVREFPALAHLIFLACSWVERPFWWYSSPFPSPRLPCPGMLLYLFVLNSNLLFAVL